VRRDERGGLSGTRRGEMGVWCTDFVVGVCTV
jgi:hypothetical protein